MLALWVRDALKHAGISGAELARRLTERLGRSFDRAAIQKMTILEGTQKTKPRLVKADEMMAIAEITGYPPPVEATEVTYVQRLSWVPAGDWWLPEQIVEGDDLPAIAVSGLPAGDWAALTVEGSSMDRISPPGSTIILNRRDKSLAPNACYVIADEEGRATYKRYRPDPPRFEPVTFTEGHETIFPKGPITVIGRVRRSVIEM